VFRKALRDVLRQIARKLVPQAFFLERITDVHIAVIEADDVMPDRTQDTVGASVKSGVWAA
jgi:hypothetical protein